MSTTSNINYKNIQNTVQDSKVFQGLVDVGVLTPGFRVYTATVDLEGLAVGSAIQAFVDDVSGEQLVLTPGQQVFHAQAGAVTPVATAANLDLFQVGLAPTALGAVGEVLSAAGTGELLNGTGVGTVYDTNGGIVGATNQFVVISTTVSAADLTAGVAKVTLIVA